MKIYSLYYEFDSTGDDRQCLQVWCHTLKKKNSFSNLALVTAMALYCEST